MKFTHDEEFYRQEARAIGREHAEFETWQRRNGYGRRNRNGNGKGNGQKNGGATPFAGGIGRAVTLTTASTIPVHPVKWAWQERVPLGALTLVVERAEPLGARANGTGLPAWSEAGTPSVYRVG